MGDYTWPWAALVIALTFICGRTLKPFINNEPIGNWFIISFILIIIAFIIQFIIIGKRDAER